jgi:hypothetical protein
MLRAARKRIAMRAAQDMAQIENRNFSKVERRRMWGLSLDGWNNVMLACLAFVAIAAVSVLLAQYVITQLAKQEAAESQAALDKYKLTVEAKVAEARSEGIKAGETASNALVRAAELEKEAANARLETEKIKSVVQWRTFSASQNAGMESALSAKPGSINLRWMDGDPEAMFLAIQLSQILQRAHWSVAPGAIKPANGIIFGLLLPPVAGDDAETLRKALIAAKLSFSAVPAPAEGVSFNTSFIEGAPFLYIGSRMPVVP